jgi:hypothetical protein
VALAGPGSIQILQHAPGTREISRSPTASWSRACSGHSPRLDHPQLAFCARFDGRVIFSHVESGETHLLAVGGFHMVIVELPPGTHSPGLGSHIVAIGPLLKARNGQRELQAVSVDRS